MINDSFIGKSLTEEDVKDLKELIKLVIYRHFNKCLDNPTVYEDIFSIGMDTCLKILKGGKYVKGKGRLFSYLYTGVRNYIGNYLSKDSRIIYVDDDLIDRMNIAENGINYALLEVSDDDIYTYLNSKLVKDTKKLNKIKSYLKYLGFEVDDENSIKAKVHNDVDKEVALILWTILQ